MPTERGAFEFEKEVLPRLVVAYESGRLVPFTGVGMSRPLCADWPGLVSSLEQQAGLKNLPAITKSTGPAELVQRANAAVQHLRRGAPHRLRNGLLRALFRSEALDWINQDDRIPPQTRELARIAWPLVLTTNYDNAYMRAYEQRFGEGGIAVVGRGAEDCQRVLNSLNTAGRALLWALQGHLGEPFHVSTRKHDIELSKEAVIDHSEYRRVTHREPHFRRAFAEVFRHRSFLFLGSGIRENYLQELFGEVLEIYGPSTRTHFAIMPEREVDDPSFMYERFQIAIVEYKNADGTHSELLDMIGKLKRDLATTTAVSVGWSWGAREHDTDWTSESSESELKFVEPELEVVRSPLPLEKGSRECLVVSAGGSRNSSSFVLSSESKSSIRATLRAWGAKEGQQPVKVDDKGYVGRYEETDAFAVRARPKDKDEKDLSEIGPAALALFDVAAYRHDCIRMQLLAAGGEADTSGGPRWSVRSFPARFSFIQIVRSWGKWRRDNPSNRCRLVLHVIDTSVTREIASGRIDVLEIFLCDHIRFWAEVVEGPDKLERRLFQRQPEKTTLREVCDELRLTPELWRLEVSPPTTVERHDDLRLRDAVLDCTLDQLSIVPGSTLHFRRIGATNSILGSVLGAISTSLHDHVKSSET